jgi:hypothetical protein
MSEEQRTDERDPNEGPREPTRHDPGAGDEPGEEESELAFPDEWGKDVPERGHGDDVG